MPWPSRPERRRYDDLAEPIRQTLQDDLSSAEEQVGHLEGQAEARERWLEQHPEIERRIAAIERELEPTLGLQERVLQRLQALKVEPLSEGLGL